MYMNNIWSPVELFYSFDYAFGKKYGPFVVVLIQLSIFIGIRGLSLKIIVIVNKINLNSFLWDRSHFYDQWHVHIIDDKVHSRKSNHFVELVPSFIDITIARHKNTNLSASTVDHPGCFKRH